MPTISGTSRYFMRYPNVSDPAVWSIRPSASVRLTCPRQTVPHYRIRVFKSPSESTRTSVFALYAQLSGLIGLLWTSPCIQVNCPCCQFIPAQLLFEDLPRY